MTVGSSKDKKFINVYFQGKRFRYWNGNAIGVAVSADTEPELLRSAFELRLREGWLPERKIKKQTPILEQRTFNQELELRLNDTLKGNYSYHHKRDCKWVLSNWMKYSSSEGLEKLTSPDIKDYMIQKFILQSRWSARTQKNVLRSLVFLTKGIAHFNQDILAVRLARCKSELHKPIKNLTTLLSALKDYDNRLYLTCLMTYGCLLRPHQELRLLKWSDIDLNRSIISLSGKRNKSGRNRIVPIPPYILRELEGLEQDDSWYVLSGTSKPFSRDYISVLWRRFKQQYEGIPEGVTLYSFRHSASINVFEKTGSLQKLQQLLGHSDMKVSLTYLRGLEVKQLDINDLPEL